MEIGTLIATVVTASATVAIAIFAIPTIQAYRKQVQIGQEQIRVSQEQHFNQFRPVLYPVGNLGSLVKTVNGKTFVQFGNQNQVIEGLQNIGIGPAFNIYGILFGPPYVTIPPTPPRERYVVWNYPALSSGKAGDKITLKEFSNINSETTIEGHSLFVPNDIDHIGIIARLTLTYHDVFDRKHASIYDYHSQSGWICRGHFSNIKYDIRELDRQTPATQQAEEFWMLAGKREQP